MRDSLTISESLLNELMEIADDINRAYWVQTGTNMQYNELQTKSILVYINNQIQELRDELSKQRN